MLTDMSNMQNMNHGHLQQIPQATTNKIIIYTYMLGI